MKYFDFLKKGDTVGLVAPSCGVSKEPYITRFYSAVKKLKELGLNVKYDKRIFNNEKIRSNSAIVRAKEFMDMWLDENVKGIISASAGEFMMEILPYIDFEKIKNSKPKFFQGFSDNTNLTFTLTTLCDMASVYGANFCSFGLREYHDYQTENIKFLFGENNKLLSTPDYEIKEESSEEEDYLAPYKLNAKKDWTILSGEKSVDVKGRLIGGCLDLLTMICGTKYDKVKEFVEKYKDDGFIWFLESCDLDVRSITRAMWQLREAGWFKYAKGIVIGKPEITEEIAGITYMDAYYEHVKDLKIPVIIDLNFGHIKPSFHVVSGALGKITCDGKSGTIEYEFK